MALYIFARFEPRPGEQHRLLGELTLILEPTRAETACMRIISTNRRVIRPSSSSTPSGPMKLHSMHMRACLTCSAFSGS